MIRGGTASFKFVLPCKCEDVKNVMIICGQTNNNGPSPGRPLPIVKVLSQCETGQDPPHLSVKLNQEETLRFSDKRKAYVQLRGETNDGAPIICRKHYVNVYPVVDDSIFDSDVITPTPGHEWIYLDGSTIIQEE